MSEKSPLIAPAKTQDTTQRKEGAEGESLGKTMKPPGFALQATQRKEDPAANAQAPGTDGAARPALSAEYAYGSEEFNTALTYISGKWSLAAAPAPVEEEKDKKKVGDSPGQDPDGTPTWVKQATTRLVNTQPNAPGLDGVNKYKGTGQTWDEDCTLAQRLVAAYYRDWYTHQATIDEGETGMSSSMEAPSNVAELMDRVGSSKTNKRAQIIGETPGAYYGWCGPASQFAISLGLLKKGYRFKTGSPPTPLTPRKAAVIPQIPKKDPEPYAGYNKRSDELAAMQESANAKAALMHDFDVANAVRLEVAKQGAYFLSNWATKKQKDNPADPKDKGHNRTIGGKAAHTAALESGDHISIVLGGSPVSGHVATVIKEEPVASAKEGGHEPGDIISKIYYISGNSKGSAVRVEVVNRELPPDGYDWLAYAGKGNKFSDLRQAEKVAMDKANKATGGNIQGQLMAKLFSTDALRKAALKQSKGAGFYQFIPANWSNKDIILPFFEIAGMDSAPYLASLTNPAMADAEAARAKKDEYKAENAKEGIPVDHQDPNFGTLNKGARADGKAIGKVKPIDNDHGWVVSIVKSSLLDANRIDGEVSSAIAGSEDQGLDAQTKMTGDVLAKYGLEKVPTEWMAMLQPGLDYWESAGGFQQ